MEKEDEDDNEKSVGATVHPLCINASNPYHECVEYCFRKILEAQQQQTDRNVSAALKNGEDVRSFPTDGDAIESEDTSLTLHERTLDRVNEGDEAEKIGQDVNDEQNDGNIYANLTPKQKRLFDLRLKLNAARKANQKEIVAEKTREEAPIETRGVSKQKWLEEKQKILKKQLEANGLDMSKAFMLDTQEAAEAKYKKWETKPAPFGWDVFNQRSLYNAYKKRTKSIPYSSEDYAKAKDADSEFYRDGSSLQYGKTPDISEENVDKMVNELEERCRKRKEFSRRRRFHEEKDIDSINDRNEHFNRKIERAFGKYTVEIKNNLERGTALPD